MYVGSRCCESTSTATAGCDAADLGGGDEPVVGVARRHAHVDDRDVRRVRAHLEQQVVRVAGAPDDLVARLLEQRRDALAQQGVVVGDDDRAARARLSARRCSVARGHVRAQERAAMVADRARPPARRARGRADPRGNRAACRGLRGGARGDRPLAGLGARRGLGGRTATSGACAACCTWHAGERRAASSRRSASG